MPPRRVSVGIFQGLEQPCPGAHQALRAPRLREELQSVQLAVRPAEDDFRQLLPSWIQEKLEESKQEPDKRAFIATAIFLGTAQACLKGSYTLSAKKVECAHLVRPISCIHPPTSMPALSSLKACHSKQAISCAQGSNPLDVALLLSQLPHCRRVAIFRCTPVEELSLHRRYVNLFEDQLFFRTTYFEAFERLGRDLVRPPDEVLKEGGIIYTSGVGILRGPLKDGAPWVEQPPQVDVLWFALPAHPQIGEQETYLQPAEREAVKAALDRAFAWACAHGADAILLSPTLCGMAGFQHPRLHFAGLVHEVSRLHERHLPEVCVASDYPPQCEASWWDEFQEGVTKGRPIPPPIIHVPTIPLMNDRLVGKDTATLLEKRRKQLGVWSLQGRTFRNPFI
mmetsp:Transcript_47080/g.88027  ORF Transcript_47080/g.88027 Transcript_47080/m.88027 type:complete len:396 (+) Transcript_47080:46-1233(+)